MRTPAPLALAAVACAASLAVTTIPVGASPQRRATPAAAKGSAAPSATSTSPASPDQYIEETSFMLKRADVDARLKTLPAAAAPAPKKKGLGGFTDSIKNAVSGDDRREEAAMKVVEDLALQASASNSKTVVVVIGGEDDREKVKTSMSSVHRHVVLALVDKSVKDSTYDNGALGTGFTDQLKGAASNVLVFLPRPNQKAHRADQTLSTRVMTDKIWTGIFAADGDAPKEVTDLASRTPKGSGTPDARGTSGTSAAAPAAASGSATTSAAASTFAIGDVVRPKIASVKLLAQPSDSAKAVATLAKTDELVVTGAEKDGFTNVQGSTASGWVKTVMLAKP
jgi:hypothetical protein